MAEEMVSAPAKSCYTFNTHRGSLCDPSGRTWHPNNPDYDPGPPPPPRPPSEKKEQKKKVLRTEGETEMRQISEVSRQYGRGYHYRYQNHKPRWQSEAISGPSSGQTNPGLGQPSGERGHGYGEPGSVRQPHGGGRRNMTFNKCVSRLFRTLRRL